MIETDLVIAHMEERIANNLAKISEIKRENSAFKKMLNKLKEEREAGKVNRRK